jgi:hypothetical protein
MTRRFSLQRFLALSLASGSLCALASATGTGSAQAPQLDAMLNGWRAAHGSSWSLMTDAQTGYLEMLYGGNVPYGIHPKDDAAFEPLARAALEDTFGMHGIDAGTLVHERTTFVPLGQIGSTDKVTVRFRETVGGLRVVNGLVSVLFSAEGALLSVHSTALPHLTGFDTNPTLTPRGASAIAAATFEARTGLSALVLEAPELVVDQIQDGDRRVPVLAYLVNARWEGEDAEPVGWRYSVDARTGAILRSERSVHFDVTGTVSAMSSPGLKPDESSNPPVAQIVKYLRCTSSSGTTFTDANGNFTYAGVNTPLAVTFQFTSGQRANVTNSGGANYTLTLTLQPNQANAITLNNPAVATVTSQANAMICIDRTSDYIHSINPADTHADFSGLAHVQVSGTCNAFYNGTSVNFYPAGGGCVNTAYTTIVNHEFGHWMNDVYGTGNGSDGMGEGNADTWSEYIYDTPIIGQDFCGVGCYIRTGNNTRQFCGDTHPGCYGEVHNDGEVWMGAAWKVRTHLKNTNGSAQGSLIADTLFIDWMEVYNQTQIRSVIETQWVTLDDNDGNISNGSPHFPDIDAGFRQQGFPGLTITCPTPSNYCVISPNSAGPGATMSFSGHNSIATNDFVLYAFGCPPNKTGLFFYGQGQTNVAFGNGRRCVASPFFRLPVTTTDFSGMMSTTLDLTSLPAGGQISQGQTWNFQGYFRDPPGGGALFNSTDGLNVSWCP